MLFEVGLFVASLDQRRQHLEIRQLAKQADEGLVIRGNGLGYYAWLRSLLIDHDWDFGNEFDDHAIVGDYVPPKTYVTDLGRRANQWSVGPAYVWALAVVPTHGILVVLGDSSPWPADGYSLPYQIAVGVTTLLVSFAGLCFIYGICRHYARPSRAALAVALLTLGTTLIYYNAVEVSMAHGAGATFLAALVWYWLRDYGSLRMRRWFVVGLLVGATALMRWQLVTFAVLPGAEAALSWWRTRENLGKHFAGLTLAALGAAAVFFPQMIAWKCVYGHWLVQPVPQIAYHWLSPSLWQVFFSYDRGLFYWTPLCALALLGFFVGRSARPESFVLLLAAFALQVYALSSLWGKGDFLKDVGNFAGAFPARSYGMRHLTEALVVLAPGLARLFERAGRISFRLLCWASFLSALGNLVLVYQYSNGALPADAGAEPGRLVESVWGFIDKEPMLFMLLVEGVGLVFLILLWADRQAALPDPNGVPSKNVTLVTVRWGILVLLILGSLLLRFLAPQPVGFQFKTFRDAAGNGHRYAVFIPHNYDSHRCYSAILFLHGFGARGTDGMRPTQGGLGTVIREQESTFDMIVAFPQSETGAWDAETPDGKRALQILDEVMKDYKIDPDRVHLTGYSRGAFGTWSLAAAYPDKWAAIVPVSGGGDPNKAEQISHIPCWCFHGEQDKVISVEESRRMIEALRRAGGNPRYKEYAGVGHNCVDTAYRSLDLIPWLRNQAREQKPAEIPVK